MDATTLTGLAVAAGVLALASLAGWWWRRRDGRVRAPAAPASDRSAELTLLARLGVEPGTPVTLLQFSSAFCAPCRATRVICARVADERDGVRHVEVDAESHLDAVRALGIWRTPTVFVVDGDGRVVARVTGQPRRDQVVDAVTPLLAEAVRS